MKFKRLILPGRFVEAYLYFDFAWLFAKDGTIRAFDIAAFCEARLNGDGAAAIALFSDNRALSANRIVQPELQISADQLLDADQTIEATAHDVDCFSYIFERVLSFKSLLDTRFYYGRGYIGTDASIVQLEARSRQNFTAERLGRASRDGLGQRLVSDRPARAFQCRFGAIGAACGSEGGLIGFDAASDKPDWTVRFEPFAEKSFGLELNGYAVTNLADMNTIELYSTSLRESNLRPQPSNLEEKGEPACLEMVKEQSYLEETASLNRMFNRDDADGIFLFSKTVWQFTLGGSANRVQLIDKNLHVHSDLYAKPVKSTLSGRALAMSTTDVGVLVETDDEVLVMGRTGWTSLVDEAVYSMRGYQNSKRYQHVMTAVTRDRAELITIWKS